jgi:hypothetical protein
MVEPNVPGPSAQDSGRTPRVDRFELIALVAFASVSIWVLGLDAWQVIAHGRVWTGTDGVLPEDQMQYLAWIRVASGHGLASNLFVLRATPADYFQPAVAVSGALTDLGVAPWLALLIWKPVAVVAVLFAIRAYVRRSLAGRWPRRAALVLVLFYGFFGVGATPDLWLGFWTWGYPFELIALAAMLGTLLAYERAQAANRASVGAPLLGALASSLHPWQGETLIAIVIVAAAVTRGARPSPAAGQLRGVAASGGAPPLRLPVGTVIATALPLGYYAILDRADLSWRLAQQASRGSSSLSRIALELAPLALPAVLAYRGRPRSFLAAATRSWPLVALGVFLLSETPLGGTPLHAFAAISVPLAILAVEGVSAVKWRLDAVGLRSRKLLAALTVAAITLPATAHELSSAAKLVEPTAGDPNFITRGEHAALSFLARDRQAGGVLTRFYLGTVVPAETGRRTFVGNCYWSQPGCSGRARMTEQLLTGSLAPGPARAFVRSSDARFVLADCASRANLVELLGSLVQSVHRFGCASVYVLWHTDRPCGSTPCGAPTAWRSTRRMRSSPAPTS